MKYIFFLLFSSITFLAVGQHQDRVDFVHAKATIQPDPVQKRISGQVTYSFEILKDVDSIFLDAKNMGFSLVKLNNRKVKSFNDGKTISIKKRFKEGKSYRLSLEFNTKPKQTVYFISWEDSDPNNNQIWTQGQGKYTSHWLPSLDDMTEKVEFDLTIVTNDELKVVANGKLVDTQMKSKGLKKWRFDMQKPMSSYLLAFVIGDYKKESLVSKSGIPIVNFFYSKDSLLVEPTYRYTKRIFDFLENEIGAPYPWQNYKQVPVKDFLYAGMENTGATVFSDGYVIDSISFVDKNYVNVNAHELTHQWFGNLVTEKDGGHHWLHEGFATYYAYLAEKNIFGEDHYYWKLYSSLIELQNGVDRGEGQSLMDPKASSLVFYEKGAWALVMLREQVGHGSFKEGIKNYLKKYQFKNVMISDFLEEMEQVSGKDLSLFEKDWLAGKDIPIGLAKKLLQQNSPSLDLWLSLEEDMKKEGDVDFDKYWQQTSSVHLKKRILDKYFERLSDDVVDLAFASDTIPIRQTLAMNIENVSDSLKTKFETLLEDESYVTIENALFKLWTSFPEEKAKYLEKTKKIHGLPNKNVRLLWLALAILTEKYEGRSTPVFFDELSGYTSSKYSWEVRMGAFQYLNETIGLTDVVLKSLIEASTHHSWQFKKYARNLLDGLLKDADYKKRLETITKGLKGGSLHYMNSKLGEQ